MIALGEWYVVRHQSRSASVCAKKLAGNDWEKVKKCMTRHDCVSVRHILVKYLF